MYILYRSATATDSLPKDTTPPAETPTRGRAAAGRRRLPCRVWCWTFHGAQRKTEIRTATQLRLNTAQAEVVGGRGNPPLSARASAAGWFGRPRKEANAGQPPTRPIRVTRRRLQSLPLDPTRRRSHVTRRSRSRARSPKGPADSRAVNFAGRGYNEHPRVSINCTGTCSLSHACGSVTSSTRPPCDQHFPHLSSC
jgi:hypothetical protein